MQVKVIHTNLHNAEHDINAFIDGLSGTDVYRIETNIQSQTVTVFIWLYADKPKGEKEK